MLFRSYEGATTKLTFIIKWLIITIVAIICTAFITIAGIVGGFLWYISLPVEESGEYTQTVDDVDSSEINQSIGD